MAYRLKQTGQEVQEILDKVASMDENAQENVIEEISITNSDGTATDLNPVEKRITLTNATPSISGLFSSTDKQSFDKIMQTIGGGADNYDFANFYFGDEFPLGDGSNTNIFWCGAYSGERENEGVVLSTCNPNASLPTSTQHQLLVAPYGIFKRTATNGTWGEWAACGGNQDGVATSEEMVEIWNGTNNN